MSAMLVCACLAWAVAVLFAARPKPVLAQLPPMKPAPPPFDLRARELAQWNGAQAREIERFAVELEARDE